MSWFGNKFTGLGQNLSFGLIYSFGASVTVFNFVFAVNQHHYHQHHSVVLDVSTWFVWLVFHPSICPIRDGYFLLSFLVVYRKCIDNSISTSITLWDCADLQFVLVIIVLVISRIVVLFLLNPISYLIVCIRELSLFSGLVHFAKCLSSSLIRPRLFSYSLRPSNSRVTR